MNFYEGRRDASFSRGGMPSLGNQIVQDAKDSAIGACERELIDKKSQEIILNTHLLSRLAKRYLNCILV